MSPAWPSALAVTPDLLARQLATIVRRGYRPATFAEAALSPANGRRVAVTFDDAYRSVLTHAAPVLERFGLVGTVFVPTAYAGSEAPMSWPGIEEWTDGPHRDELVPMNWDELRGLAARGWEIASHTRTHPRLTEVDDTTLAAELIASREEVEAELGGPCRTIAYPYGDQDARVRAAAAVAGYGAGAALDRSMRRGDPFAVPRVGVYPPDKRLRFAAKTSPLVRRLQDRRAAADDRER